MSETAPLAWSFSFADALVVLLLLALCTLRFESYRDACFWYELVVMAR